MVKLLGKKWFQKLPSIAKEFHVQIYGMRKLLSFTEHVNMVYHRPQILIL